MNLNLQSSLGRIGLFFTLILVFYKPIYGIFSTIQDVISRSNATNIKFQGLDIDLANSQTQKSFDKEYQIYKDNFQMAFQLPILDRYRNALKTQLTEANLQPNEQINLLLDLLTNAQLCLSMLRIDKQLSPEQIEALCYLNNRNTPIKQTELLQFLKQEKIKYKDIYLNFDLFNILFKLNLIAKNFSFYSLTDLGKAYLIFRVWSGRPINFKSIDKPLNQ